MSQRSKKAQAKSSKSGRSQVNVRTTPELLTRIDEARIDTSRSEFIVQAIEAYLGIEPASDQTTATIQSLVDAAVAQAIHSVTRTLESRLKALESRLSSSDVDANVDALVDEVSVGAVDERVDSVNAPVDSGDDAPEDALEGEELATSGELGLEEATRDDRHRSQESEVGVDEPVDSADAPFDLVDDAGDDAVEGEELATAGDSGLEEATGGDHHASQESEVGVDQAFDYRTHGLSGRELASRLSVSPSSITSNRQKKGTKAFAKWTSQQDPDGLAWSYQQGRYYLSEPKGS
ncbi:ribbon-helix-helix domain-containing protein [Laspinema olomoucense]|uniref:Ribbon-helix-helix domain-containing protein n=1 Tax=Laspinema olomoucense D3b TaxID=2953688 RepID=A0ABT2NHN3_9CYAN|nr:ribbon-helix-helix domain-containing protein [Laspinema sp. D3b]MCT7981389.1 ribbon-helix-helix domain-containing protein [Laspinema sp. D3b]